MTNNQTKWGIISVTLRYSRPSAEKPAQSDRYRTRADIGDAECGGAAPVGTLESVPDTTGVASVARAGWAGGTSVRGPVAGTDRGGEASMKRISYASVGSGAPALQTTCNY